MQQRQLRLGDIVDDYCPRERRVTNHAIVAMIEDQVKQTRCTTCDAEHEYKAAKVPPQRKKKESTSALYKQVLSDAKADAPGTMLARHNGDQPKPHGRPQPAPEPPPEEAPAVEPAEPHHEPEPPVVDAAPHEEEPPQSEEEGPVHRPLIRATLPRPAGQTPERPAPEFTYRSMSRGGRFRPGNNRGPQRQNRPHGGGPGGPARSAGGARPQGSNMRDGNRMPPQHGSRHSQRGPNAPPRRGGGRGKKR